MSNIIGLNTKLFGLEKNIKQSEPTRAANDLGQLSDPAGKERVLNPIVSESYMKKYIEEHGGGGGGTEPYKCIMSIYNGSDQTIGLTDIIPESAPFNYFTVLDEEDYAVNIGAKLSDDDNATILDLPAGETTTVTWYIYPYETQGTYTYIIALIDGSLGTHITDTINCSAVLRDGAYIITANEGFNASCTVDLGGAE